MDKFDLAINPKPDLVLMKNQSLDENYNPFDVVSENDANPLVSLFSSDSRLTFQTKYQIADLDHVTGVEGTIPRSIHIKYAPLLDPIHLLIGKYEKGKPLEKIASPYNSAYVDAFFNYLSSTLLHKYKFIHGVDYYGSITATQKRFRFNMDDEYDYLQDSDFFMKNKGIMYEFEKDDSSPKVNVKNETMHNKAKLLMTDMDDDFAVDAVDESEDYEGEEGIEGIELMFQAEDESSDDDSELSESTNSNVDSDQECSSVSDTENIAYLYNFPVHMIFMEKCDGTFDELLDNQVLKEEEISSALMQIVFMLIIYQQAFHFTHNDLHTNNIVFTQTTIPFIMYEYQDLKYKVPTYGRIYKMIDFGRSIYRVGDQKICSDSFAIGGDAHSQYNTEPFFDLKKARLEPNPSFDLCRLGCSMYDFVFDVGKPLPEKMNHVQKTILRWCQDDVGKNILYKKNGTERYPNFKLYKMISRLVHHCVPKEELCQPIFAQYKVISFKATDSILDVDVIPKH